MRRRKRRLDPLPEIGGIIHPRTGKLIPFERLESGAQKRMAAYDALPKNLRALVNEYGNPGLRAYRRARENKPLPTLNLEDLGD